MTRTSPEVACTAGSGVLDLIVPTADVPLITWVFGGRPGVPESALLSNADTPGPARNPEADEYEASVGSFRHGLRLMVWRRGWLRIYA